MIKFILLNIQIGILCRQWKIRKSGISAQYFRNNKVNKVIWGIMGCLLWKIYFASVFLSIKKGSNFGPPIILYKLVDEEIGRILKISIMFCVGNCLINLCLNRIAIFCIGKSSAYRGFANGLIRSV